MPKNFHSVGPIGEQLFVNDFQPVVWTLQCGKCKADFDVILNSSEGFILTARTMRCPKCGYKPSSDAIEVHKLKGMKSLTPRQVEP